MAVGSCAISAACLAAALSALEAPDRLCRWILKFPGILLLLWRYCMASLLPQDVNLLRRVTCLRKEIVAYGIGSRCFDGIDLRSCAGGFLFSVLLGGSALPGHCSRGDALVVTHGSCFCSRTRNGPEYEAALWTLDGFGRFTFRLDPLGAIFLLAAGIVYFSISLFARNFINDQLDEAYLAHRFGGLYFALMASVVLILVASDAPLFLISWECMSILCILLINYDPRQQSDKKAGYIMLAMSEAGFLAVVVAFLILGRTATDLSFPL